MFLFFGSELCGQDVFSIFPKKNRIFGAVKTFGPRTWVRYTRVRRVIIIVVPARTVRFIRAVDRRV